MWIMRRVATGLICCVALLILISISSAGAASAPETVIASKRPIVAGACIDCPWGLISDILKVALKPHGYDLQVCYTCSRANNPRIVAGQVKPPSSDPEGSPPPPSGSVDFGVTSAFNLIGAYQGIRDYAGEPHKNFRLIAFIEHPQYAVMAVKTSSGITDLHQIKEKRIPVRMMAAQNSATTPILEYYGITKKDVESWDGSFVPFTGTVPTDPDKADVVIWNSLYLGDAPEVRFFYEYTAKNDLRYLPMPQDLREKLAKDLGMKLVNMPRSLFRGVNQPVPTVGRSGHAVYARDDMPADFAYLLAKALDENRSMLLWTHMPLSYESRTVAHVPGVPLHPGAERYYREVGYLK
jgi:uncharacterized protein